MRLAQVAMGGEEMESGWVGVTYDHWVLDQGQLLEEELHRVGHRAKMEETLLDWEGLLVIQSGSG